MVKLITERGDDLAMRIGRRLELIGVAVRRPSLPRPGIDAALLTTDVDSLVRRDDVDLVIELIGGIEPARSLIITALEHGASVVTANKALLAEDGTTLYAAAEKAGVDLYFEAAVAGAIPIIRPLRESLVGDEITSVMGIVNGTTNFILDKMDSEGSSFAETLEEAQALGYAEADPTADIEGFDAAAKAAILSSLAFHSRVSSADVYREGITEVTAGDIASAREMGCVVKLLAICALTDPDDAGERAVSVRVHPAMIPRSHPLATVGGPYNAVFVESRSAGRLMFTGPGAGGQPTASAVLGDLVTVARNRLRGAAGPGSRVMPSGRSRRSARSSPATTSPRRRRRRRRAGPDRPAVRRLRRLDPDRTAAGPRGRRQTGDRHAPCDRRRPVGHGRRAAETGRGDPGHQCHESRR
ncbi:hypothetical protein GCM10027613_45900 [Microlunatus endophyticus]